MSTANPNSQLSQRNFIIVAIIAVILSNGFLYSQFRPAGYTGTKLVQGFPVMPVYPGAILSGSTSDPNEGAMYIGVRYGATWKSGATIPEISKWYLDKLKVQGWTIDTPPANLEATDVQLITLFNNAYSLNMSFIRYPNTDSTNITAEFSTNYRNYSEATLGTPSPTIKQ